MSVLPIVKYGDPVLRENCKPVEKITPEVRKLVTDLLDTLYSVPGVGLAAPQVGVPLRVCVIDLRNEGRKQPIVLINPKIVHKEGKMDGEEGCLSFPGLWDMVKRYKKVRVEATDGKGFPVQVEGEDLLSRALQHEIDHLDGKVFMDYLSLLKRKKMEFEIKRRKKRGEW